MLVFRLTDFQINRARPNFLLAREMIKDRLTSPAAGAAPENFKQFLSRGGEKNNDQQSNYSRQERAAPSQEQEGSNPG